MTQGRDEPAWLRFLFQNLLDHLPRVELSEDGHAAVTAVARHLFLVIFIIASVNTVQGVLRDYRYARSILRDHGVAIAVPGSTAAPPAGTSNTANVDPSLYSFAVDGTTYSATYPSDEPSVQVAYARAQPGRFDRLEVLESNGSVLHLILGVFVAVPVFAVACWASFALLTQFVFRIGRWSDFHGRTRN